jgi:uncharacterized protein (DUF58 family)
MIRPTRRAVLLLAAQLPLALLPFVLGPGFTWPWRLALLATVALLAADAWSAWQRRGMRLAVGASDHLFIGDPDPLRVELRAATGREAADAGLRVQLRVETSERLDAPATCELTLAADGSAEVLLPLRPRSRGTAAIDRAWLCFEGPLGFVECVAQREIGRQLLIVPDVRAVRQEALRLARRSPLAGRKVERFAGDGSEFEALREFVPGFDPRTIDWKASARHRKLLARKLRAERNHPLVLAFDTGARMLEPIDHVSRLDRAINAALLLGYVALKAEDRVALFAFDSAVRAFTPFLSGAAQFDRLRQAAAELEAVPAEANYTLGLAELTRRLARRSLVVVFTDFADAIGAELLVENLGRLARRHVVLLVAVRDDELDRVAGSAPADVRRLHQAVAATELIRDRALVLEQVRRLGVLVLDAPAARVRTELIDRYLEVQRRELVA